MTLEERVAFLEGRVEEHARQTDGLREALASLESRMDRRFEGMDVRLNVFEERMDRRFEGVDRRLNAMDEKLSRYFLWMIGAQVTTLAVVTAFVAR